MGNEYRAKVFKSGNSVALRLPKALGFSAGQEVCVREEAGKYSFEPVAGDGRIDLTGVCLLNPGERESAQSRRGWDDPDWAGWPQDAAS
jgi:antitoxin VapB